MWSAVHNGLCGACLLFQLTHSGSRKLTYSCEPPPSFFGEKSIERPSCDVRLDPESETLLSVAVSFLDDTEDSAIDAVLMLSISFDDVS